MKVYQLILLAIININLMAQNRPTEIEIQKLFKDLEKNHYYKYVEDKELIPVCQEIISHSLINYSDGLCFPDLARVLRKKSNKNVINEHKLFDYRSFYLGGDYLFRGDFAIYLEKVKQMFRVRGLKFDFKDENMFWREEDKTDIFYYFKHDITINDSTYIIAEGNLKNMGAYQYIKKFMEIITIELEKQGHEDKFVLMTNPDSVYVLLINDEIRKIFDNMPESIPNKLVEIN